MGLGTLRTLGEVHSAPDCTHSRGSAREVSSLTVLDEHSSTSVAACSGLSCRRLELINDGMTVDLRPRLDALTHSQRVILRVFT